MPIPNNGKVCFYAVANVTTPMFPEQFGSMIIMPFSYATGGGNNECLAIFFTNFGQVYVNQYNSSAGWVGWKP